MDETNRSDQVTDALITKGLLRADGGKSCPDPALLAGIHEGNLEPDETERWITHVADCQRCQAPLGALARADEAARPSPAVASRRRERWREQSARSLWWPVRPPLAAAALIVLAVWVVDPDSTPDGRPSPLATGADAIGEPTVAEPAVAATNQAPPERGRAPARESVSPLADEAENRLATETGAGPPAIQALNRPAVAPPETVLEAASGASFDSPASAEAAPRRGASARRAAAPQAALFVGPVLLRSPQDAIQWRAESTGAIARTDDGGLRWRVQLTVPERVVASTAPSAAVA